MTLYISTPWRRMVQRKMLEQDGDFTAERDIFFPVDIKAEDDSFLISALLPGVKPEDLNVQVVNETVSIQGTISHDRSDKENYLLQERPGGHFYRSLTLPDSLDSNKAEAALKDGVLNLRIPKAEEARPKTIKVVAKEK
jgi:HSP20 family protein